MPLTLDDIRPNAACSGSTAAFLFAAHCNIVAEIGGRMFALTADGRMFALNV